MPRHPKDTLPPLPPGLQDPFAGMSRTARTIAHLELALTEARILVACLAYTHGGNVEIRPGLFTACAAGEVRVDPLGPGHFVIQVVSPTPPTREEAQAKSDELNAAEAAKVVDIRGHTRRHVTDLAASLSDPTAPVGRARLRALLGAEETVQPILVTPELLDAAKPPEPGE